MAAKEIQVSSDGGSTWFTLPGSTGEFSPEGEALTDTIFGQTFQSQFTGLIGWTVSANSIFKGFAGYQAKLLKTGSGTATTAEAFSQESGQIYKIDDSTKEIWDRNATITVFDDAADVTDQVEWFDYLFGRLKFLDSYTVTGVITADLTWFGTTVLGKGNAYTLTQTAAAIDNTTFEIAQGNSGTNTFEPGLRTVELELEGIFDAATNAKADLQARNELIVEIDPAGDGLSNARGFMRITSSPQSGDVGALEEQTISLAVSVPDDDLMLSPFRWEHDAATTLNQATQIILDSWQDQTEIDVRYLPSGTPGQSPLDGITGKVIMTDVSLSGGLSDMNIFSAEMQGTGQWTEV